MSLIKRLCLVLHSFLKIVLNCDKENMSLLNSLQFSKEGVV